MSLSKRRYRSPYYDPSKLHHTLEGFRNAYASPPREGGFWRWKWQNLLHGRALTLPDYRPPFAAPDRAFLAQDRTLPTVTGIGHATVLLQVDGINILTDPQLSQRTSPLRFMGPKRVTPPALDLRTLPHIDVVLISRSHYDHLDLGSVRGLARQPGGPPRFLVPLGLAPWFAGHGLLAEELDWWESRAYERVRFTLTPAQHWSARSLRDRNRTLWGAWHADGSFSFHFA